MALVERERELSELVTALDRARRGHGTTVLLSGEAGIGKTSLLARFSDHAAAKARVFRGACEDLMTPRPLGPFRDMARGANGALGSAGVIDRDALLDALLEEMAFFQRPAVVIVEDIHWADQASLDILRVLARRVAELPAMLVVSYREQDLPDDHPVIRMSGLLPSTDVLRLELAPLSDSAVSDLAVAAGVEPGPVVQAVGGNPFYLSEVLAAPTASVPTSVRHAVLARVATLPDGCRTAVQQLSVIPTVVDTPLLDRLLPNPGVLEPAERVGILLYSYRGVQFRHELARRAVAESLSQSRRLTAHRRVLDALASSGAESSRLVHHAVAVQDDQLIVANAAAAATQSARAEGHREAARFAELALKHSRDRPALEVAALHRVAAGALYSLNQFGAAAEHADRAVAIWDAAGSAPMALGEALLISARMNTLLAEPTVARAKAARAIRLMEPLGPSRGLALAYSTLGSQEALLAHFDEAIIWTDSALRIARATGADDAAAHALGFRGVARTCLGDEGGRADLVSAIALAKRLRHWDYLTVAAHNLAVVLLRSGEVREAVPYLDLGEQVAREHNLDAALFRIEAQQCQCLILQGGWPEAERRLRGLLERQADPGASAVNPLAFLGRLLSRRGDPDAADLIASAWRLARATGEDQKMAVAAGARIESLWLRGDFAELQVAGAELLPVAIRAGHRFLRAEILRYLRRSGLAVDGFPGCPDAFAAGISGDWAEAARRWERAGNPYERALELSESPDAATVGSSLRVLDRLGANRTAAKVRERLRQTGVQGVSRGPRSSTRSNPGHLTDRQLEVLGLVIDGCTNAEIAGRLVLSPRTIDNHVSAVLHALGVRSRRDASSAADRLGLAPAGADDEPGSGLRTGIRSTAAPPERPER